MSAEYVPLFPLLADYWDKPLSELPEALQARAGSLMDWDFLTPVARSEFVSQLEEKYAVAYQQAAHDETGLNGDAINWRYWVHQMPVLSAAQAACLMSALEPHLFENLNGQPSSDDPTKNIQKARKIQELAEAQGKLTASPAEWVEWAKSLRIKVHTGFLLAVWELPEVPIVKAEDAPVTTPAPVAVEHAAPVEQSTPSAVVQAAPVAIVNTTSKASDEPPGKMPRTATGKLTVEAAWEIERETGKQTTADIVMLRLQTWASAMPSNHPELIKSIPYGVVWATKKLRKEKDYMIEDCGKHLSDWYKSRI